MTLLFAQGSYSRLSNTYEHKAGCQMEDYQQDSLGLLYFPFITLFLI